ncbi:hypothetical protein AVEN_142088-1 [Araneus ventricosus]|uniref:Uncharacterized protein n=1 Tax=Araneus ventricosus TaxID=182803 RepID=A0A4Y2LJN4_ARAVE|nr:hypothetical protein AVEN_142088-1 [Araneus ventricosus]
MLDWCLSLPCMSLSTTADAQELLQGVQMVEWSHPPTYSSDATQPGFQTLTWNTTYCKLKLKNYYKYCNGSLALSPYSSDMAPTLGLQTLI